MARNLVYRPDRQGMARLVQSTPIQRAVVAAAELGLARAQQGAPRRSGAFAAGFEVVPATVPGGRTSDPRAAAIIRNRVPYAGYVRKSKARKAFMASIAPHVTAVGRGR